MPAPVQKAAGPAPSPWPWRPTLSKRRLSSSSTFCSAAWPHRQGNRRRIVASKQGPRPPNRTAACTSSWSSWAPSLPKPGVQEVRCRATRRVVLRECPWRIKTIINFCYFSNTPLNKTFHLVRSGLDTWSILVISCQWSAAIFIQQNFAWTYQGSW